MQKPSWIGLRVHLIQHSRIHRGQSNNSTQKNEQGGDSFPPTIAFWYSRKMPLSSLSRTTYCKWNAKSWVCIT